MGVNKHTVFRLAAMRQVNHYLRAKTGRSVQDVREHFGMSRSTAIRYMKELGAVYVGRSDDNWRIKLWSTRGTGHIGPIDTRSSANQSVVEPVAAEDE